MTQSHISRAMFLKEVTLLLNQVPLTQILTYFGYDVASSNGVHAYVLCPFHADQTIGSFVVSDDTQQYKCFACGAGGKSSVQLLFDLLEDKTTFEDKMIELAIHFQLISVEYKTWWQQNATLLPKLAPLVPSVTPIDVREETLVKNLARCDRVYRLLCQWWSYQHPSDDLPLSLTHRHYLLESRALPLALVQSGGYFTFPTSHDTHTVMSFLEQTLQPYETLTDLLAGVPGFYQQLPQKTWQFNGVQGIGIPIYDAKSHLVGIQIRHDHVEEGKQRYRWFSSAFAVKSSNTSRWGCRAESPAHIHIPSQSDATYCFVTEGVFKSQWLSATTQQYSCSIQGVSSWRRLLPEFEALKQKTPQLTHVILAFDSDLVYNPSVAKFLVALGQKLQSLYPDLHISVLIWHPENGKGADDVLFKAGFEAFRVLTLSSFLTQFEQFERLSLNETPQSQIRVYETLIYAQAEPLAVHHGVLLPTHNSFTSAP